MSAVILRSAIHLTGKTLPRFSPELCSGDVDPPNTLPAEELIPTSLILSGDLPHKEIELVCAPLRQRRRRLSHQAPHPPGSTTESPMSTREEDTDDEDDQERDGNSPNWEPEAARRRGLTHRGSTTTDVQTLVHKWSTERGISWSQKFYHEQVGDIGYALCQLDPPVFLARPG
jgi:hypothetical protein